MANFIQQRSGRGRAGGLMGFLNPIGPPRRGQRTQLSAKFKPNMLIELFFIFHIIIVFMQLLQKIKVFS